MDKFSVHFFLQRLRFQKNCMMTCWMKYSVTCYPDTLEPGYQGMSAPDTSMNLPESLRVAPSIRAKSCEALWSAVKIWS